MDSVGCLAAVSAFPLGDAALDSSPLAFVVVAASHGYAGLAARYA